MNNSTSLNNPSGEEGPNDSLLKKEQISKPGEESDGYFTSISPNNSSISTERSLYFLDQKPREPVFPWGEKSSPLNPCSIETNNTLGTEPAVINRLRDISGPSVLRDSRLYLGLNVGPSQPHYDWEKSLLEPIKNSTNPSQSSDIEDPTQD